MNFSEPPLLADSYAVSPQVSHDQKFQSKLVLPQNITAKSPQLQYQAKPQTITAQLPLQTEKRVVEEAKPSEPIECINVGTQKTAEKMRKDEGKYLYSKKWNKNKHNIFFI